MSKIVPNRVFEDYDPPTDLVTEEGCDTLLIYLPGFKKEQLKVQLTISRVLKISGERPLGGNRYRRFQKEFRVPPNCDTKEITAKFEGGILYVRQPKSISSAAPPPAERPQRAPAETTRPQQQPPPQPQLSVPPPLPSPKPQSQQHAPPPPPPPPPSPPQLQSQKQASPSQPPLPSPPQPQPQKHTSLPLPPPPSPPQLQSQKPAFPTPPLPPPQSQTQQEAPAKGRKEGTSAERKDEASSESEVIQRPRQVFQSGLFRELRKPDNLQKLGVSVLLVVIIALYISYMFKSLMGNGHNTVSDYDLEL